MIRDLLVQSRQAHDLAKRARRAGRVDDHFTAIQTAQATRREAHLLDPDHLDQAWIEESSQGYHHLDLLVFYASELAKDQSQERVMAKARLIEMQRVVDESVSIAAAFKATQPEPLTH